MRRPTAMLLLACLALVTAAASAGPAPAHAGSTSTTTQPREFEVLGHLELTDESTDWTANLWAHDGFAYVGHFAEGGRCFGTGVDVVDVRDPREPRLLARFASAYSDPRLGANQGNEPRVQDVHTPAFTGTLAVAAIGGCPPNFAGFRGFGLYDVTDPTHPQQLALVDTAPCNGPHELWLQAAANRAFVYVAEARCELRTSPDGVTPGTPGFRIFDVSDPRRPAQVGSWGIWTNLGIKPTVNELVHSVTTDGQARYAYVSYWDFGTVILDVSDPAHPVPVGRTPGGDLVHAHTAALAQGGRLLIETRELGATFGVPGYPLFYDISDPARPVLLSTFTRPPSPFDTVHNVQTRGALAFFSWYDQGVVAVDLGDPANPVEVAHFVPPPSVHPGCDPGCPDVWGIALDRRLVLASDIGSGLWVLKLRCAVPDLRLRTLAAASAALDEADCMPGRVKRAYSTHAAGGRVIAQRPAAGTSLAYPGKVSFTVSRGRKR